ncbi:MAG: biopolymer transporter ExbD [candidate division KSB1 bacterium]|nr:biopolymer transporter ExbD [candidate division KSB1 bacterium]MDZ7274646.1 biopolymer transporter ExbD [candidate division KSB1 bacterium]MDZ7285471.1 biopolymer transporter ExbD [candidate division KSB1 bacterium]MDZ7298503.1 biopolymer transporter ExbD [candidate division KSB1 bacterium]MDZ7306273.1 biopolymer transporter ExbD [candidate division KSB1 bacterium]
MSGSGMIVRYIDIVMILLFGFICSAELSETSHIELAKTVELPPGNPDPEMVIFVGILPDGSYLFDNEKYRTADLAVLEQYLQQTRVNLEKARYKMRVRLRANHDTPIRFLMKAAEVCDRLEVLKTFDVRIGSKVKS